MVSFHPLVNIHTFTLIPLFSPLDACNEYLHRVVSISLCQFDSQAVCNTLQPSTPQCNRKCDKALAELRAMKSFPNNVLFLRGRSIGWSDSWGEALEESFNVFRSQISDKGCSGRRSKEIVERYSWLLWLEATALGYLNSRDNLCEVCGCALRREACKGLVSFKVPPGPS